MTLEATGSGYQKCNFLPLEKEGPARKGPITRIEVNK
jgi:hypothetical protein